MKTNCLLASVAMLAVASCTQAPDPFDVAFAEARKMAESIAVPQFCTDTFNIVNFGADQQGDALGNKQSINAAIDSANASGGGVVLIPEGEWLTGPIVLKSNVNLHLAKGALLKFSTTYSDYLPGVDTRWEGVDCHNLSPLIYADKAVNIGITGKGIIDGQASNEIWWFMKGRPKYGWAEGMLSQELGGRDTLLAYDREKVAYEQRKNFVVEDALRPQLINICNSKNVIIEGVTLRNSPFWNIHPLFVDGLVVRGVRIESHGPNSDGCDPESCSNVLIEDCFFDTGDDCIAIKSGRNNDGRKWNKPSENIYVRNCTMADGHGGVVLGSEISGGFKNLWVENCKMDSPELDRVIRIKTSTCRGNVIENVWVRNVEVGVCKECVLKINLIYEQDENCDHSFNPTVRNVNMENVSSKKSKYGVYAIGIKGLEENIDNININNCSFDGVEDGNSIENATNVRFSNTKINGKAFAN